MATFKKAGRLRLWVDALGRPTEESALQALHHLGYRAGVRRSGVYWLLRGKAVPPVRVAHLLGLMVRGRPDVPDVATVSAWAESACGDKPSGAWAVLREDASPDEKVKLHLRLPEPMYEGLQSIAKARAEGRLSGEPKPVHALVREFLGQMPRRPRLWHLAAGDREAVGREVHESPALGSLMGTAEHPAKTRLLHVQIPRALHTELEQWRKGLIGRRLGEDDADRPSRAVRIRNGRPRDPGSIQKKASLSSYARSRLWDAMRAEFYALAMLARRGQKP